MSRSRSRLSGYEWEEHRDASNHLRGWLIPRGGLQDQAAGYYRVVGPRQVFASLSAGNNPSAPSRYFATRIQAKRWIDRRIGWRAGQ